MNNIYLNRNQNSNYTYKKLLFESLEARHLLSSVPGLTTVQTMNCTEDSETLQVCAPVEVTVNQTTQETVLMPVEVDDAVTKVQKVYFEEEVYAGKVDSTITIPLMYTANGLTNGVKFQIEYDSAWLTYNEVETAKSIDDSKYPGCYINKGTKTIEEGTTKEIITFAWAALEEPAFPSGTEENPIQLVTLNFTIKDFGTSEESVKISIVNGESVPGYEFEGDSAEVKIQLDAPKITANDWGISWETVEKAEKYTVEYYNTDSKEWVEIETTDQTSLENFPDSLLGKEINVRVIAKAGERYKEGISTEEAVTINYASADYNALRPYFADANPDTWNGVTWSECKVTKIAWNENNYKTPLIEPEIPSNLNNWYGTESERYFDLAISFDSSWTRFDIPQTFTIKWGEELFDPTLICVGVEGTLSGNTVTITKSATSTEEPTTVTLRFDIPEIEVGTQIETTFQLNMYEEEKIVIKDCIYDLISSNAIDIKDLVQFAKWYNNTKETDAKWEIESHWKADFNSDDQIDIKDLVLFAKNYNIQKGKGEYLIYDKNYKPHESPTPVSASPQLFDAIFDMELDDEELVAKTLLFYGPMPEI